MFFRQRRDPLLKRGYFQKSLVLITPHNYVGLFTRIVGWLGSAYFDVGEAILETVCHTIASWPTPDAGAVLELPFLGTTYCVRLPYDGRPQMLETCSFPGGRLRPEKDVLSQAPASGLGVGHVLTTAVDPRLDFAGWLGEQLRGYPGGLVAVLGADAACRAAGHRRAHTKAVQRRRL